MDVSKVKHIAHLVVRIIMGLLLLLAGTGKFQMAEIWIKKFAEWGYPSGFHLVTGLLEIIAAILLFIPKIWKYGLYLALIIMVFAAGTHLFNDEAKEVMSPGIYMVLGGIIWLLRKR